MSTGANGHHGDDGDHGLRLRPTVTWPHAMTVGVAHLVEVDLDLITADGTPPADWPFDEEEYAYTCLVTGGADFSLWAVRDTSVVVHRFGGSYGPAQFVVTPKAGAVDSAGPDSRSLSLTILNPWGVPLSTYDLPVDVRPDDGEPLPEPTVDVPVQESPRQEGQSADGEPGGVPPFPGPDPDPDPDPGPSPTELDKTVPDGILPPPLPGDPPLIPDDVPLLPNDRPPSGVLTEHYRLIGLHLSRDRSLHPDQWRLFGPGDRTGATAVFTVRCLPSGDEGTAFAIFASPPAGRDGPDRLLAVQSAKFPAGTYRLTAELLYPYPGHVRIRGLPAALRDDERSLDEILAAVPRSLPAGTGPVHLIAAIEISGEPATVLQRIDRVTALVEHVAQESAEPVSYSVLTYGPHHINRDTDRYPEIPVHPLAWEATAQSALDTLGALASRGALAKGYAPAAQLECALAEVASRLTGREGRPVLVTAGARPAHPPFPDAATGIIPCPRHNDGLAILDWLASRYPAMGLCAIRDAGREDILWERLGRDVADGYFYAPEFAAQLRLTGQPARILPLPLLGG